MPQHPKNGQSALTILVEWEVDGNTLRVSTELTCTHVAASHVLV